MMHRLARTCLVILSTSAILAGASACETSSGTSVRMYEYTDNSVPPDRPQPQGEPGSEYEMVAPGEMVSPGEMVPPGQMEPPE